MSDENGLARKGRRVAGFFVVMLGAGLILESSMSWAGLALMVVGGGIIFSGFVAKGGAAVIAEGAREEP